MAKKATAPVKEKKPEGPLEQLILDTPLNRYQLVTLAIRWAEEIRSRQNAPKYTNEVVEMALQEILSGKVSIDDIEKLPPLKEARRNRLMAEQKAREEQVKAEQSEKDEEKKETKKGKRK